MHQAGLVHCDIKASNVLLSENGYFLNDFGATTRVGEPVTERTPVLCVCDALGYHVAQPALDWELLVVMALVNLGSLSVSRGSALLTYAAVQRAVRAVALPQLQALLQALLDCAVKLRQAPEMSNASALPFGVAQPTQEQTAVMEAISAAELSLTRL